MLPQALQARDRRQFTVQTENDDARGADDAFEEEGHLLVGVQAQEGCGGDAEIDRKYLRRTHHGEQIGVGVREQHDRRSVFGWLRPCPRAAARVAVG